MNMKTDQLPIAELPDFFRDMVAAKEAAAEQALELNRRGFLKLTGVAGGGLVLGMAMGTSNKAMAQAKKGAPTEATLSVYVQVKPNGRVNLFSKNPECGQGIKTGLPLMIAEELDCAWKDVDVVQADIDAKRYGGQQFAGGSLSTPMNWIPMRVAGATARAMILAAAAKKLKLPLEELTTAETRVVHAKSKKSWSYGEFAELAATMPVPDAKEMATKLKDPKDFKLLGKRYPGVDNVGIVTGKPLFGADTRMEGMVYATFTKSPQVGGVAVSFNEAHIKSLKGVVDAFIVEPFGDGRMFPTGTGAHLGGIAIVTDSTWAAIKAKRELEVQWDLSKAETATWSDLAAQAEALKDKDGEPIMVNAGPPGPNAKRVSADRGDVAAAFASAAKVVTGFYEYPYVSHAQLEPQTTTALYKDGKIELWAPSQIPQGGQGGAATRIGLTINESTLHQMRIGGGFGRKLANDYAFEAAAIAKKMEGRPVKLQWTREDDMMHDYYRPGGFHSYKAALDAKGNLTAFQDHFMSHSANGTAPMTSADLSPAVFPMDVVPNLKLTQTLFKNAMPTGAMRAPSSNAFGFTFQSFMHELALASGKSHAQFLLDVLGDRGPSNPERPQQSMNKGRAMDVIKMVVERSGYGKQMPKGQGQGLSFYYSHSGYVAQVAEVTVSANKEVKVNKVWAVADFGFIHNKSSAENQLEGGILDGLSQVFNSKITFNKGVVQQQNFHQYPLIRMPQIAVLDTHFLESDSPPTGAGEPSVPPLAAAVANAIFNATGQRIRKMPLIDSGYRLV